MWRENVYSIWYNVSFRRLYSKLLYRRSICEYFKISALTGIEPVTVRVFLL